MQPISKGQIVAFEGYLSNGELDHPAIITRVWGPYDEDCVGAIARINVAVIPDFGSIKNFGSIPLFQTRAEAAAAHDAAACGPHFAYLLEF